MKVGYFRQIIVLTLRVVMYLSLLPYLNAEPTRVAGKVFQPDCYIFIVDSGPSPDGNCHMMNILTTCGVYCWVEVCDQGPSSFGCTVQ
jgi:hypothetical protein